VNVPHLNLAVKLPEGAPRLDIGNPKTLWEAMKTSYEIAGKSIF